ncbi:hypothetical protein E2R60_19105 [Paenibacillus dendritiformis]|nr:hypothetical protein [Paenibacillus dendritiformis]TDL51724.1 hypothetical protein E2R60_19105 [Paenibacillus dendritiformis]
MVQFSGRWKTPVFYEGVEMSIYLIKTWHPKRFKSSFFTERRDPPIKNEVPKNPLDFLNSLGFAGIVEKSPSNAIKNCKIAALPPLMQKAGTQGKPKTELVSHQNIEQSGQNDSGRTVFIR